MNAFSEIMNGFDFAPLLEILESVLPALICITFHELCHGLTALMLGDDTARQAGRLTLNPIRHLDLMGLAMMIVFHVGWAKPVPVNMYRFKNPKRGMAVTALAGPVSNLLLAILAFFLYGILYIPLTMSEAGTYVLDMIYLTAILSIGLGVFNLIPVPPLDGSKVLFSVISDSAYETLMRLERYGMIAIILLMNTDLLGNPMSKAINFIGAKLIWFAQAGFDLYQLFI